MSIRQFQNIQQQQQQKKDAEEKKHEAKEFQLHVKIYLTHLTCVELTLMLNEFKLELM